MTSDISGKVLGHFGHATIAHAGAHVFGAYEQLHCRHATFEVGESDFIPAVIFFSEGFEKGKNEAGAERVLEDYVSGMHCWQSPLAASCINFPNIPSIDLETRSAEHSMQSEHDAPGQRRNKRQRFGSASTQPASISSHSYEPYQALPTHHIRVLCLEPGPWDSPLRASFDVVSLDPKLAAKDGHGEHEGYEAISYVW